MLRIESQTISHHGWKIEVVREAEEFFFQCYHPDLPDFCNDGSAHSTAETAFAAARHFIDREVAIQALLEVVETWMRTGKISEDEYWNLTDFA
ncbi:hypothetical protein H6F88_22415 [Oculatella sp. FACHB-28]|uniref:hypothetical protein n=1 Tax=Cyanophyceae TaxID=3028117 RepID=UPI001681D226|nr:MULTISPECIES: hypothetical protein [Cyanophyceae]MBD1998954.1 hypothetical protein [Leptolyngbya sp. FACHB-541]MBD2058718.1 hypothetical protein [Oculatella sp. FACHB-28]MBD2068703.1 hypothetical protein [Leptolyngbya sp. FACHB-671]